MSSQETTLEADGVRVVFFRRGDRYAHRVEALDPATGDWAAALESREGSDADLWPPSPPFQQLHVERRPAGDVVLLVGMAGKSHWSAAVEVAADRRSIVFDVAVRYQLPPVYLGSAYPYIANYRGRRPDFLVEGGAKLDIMNELSDGPFIRPSGEFPHAPATLGWKYAVSCSAGRP